jgi:Tripartite tricarboxylate transporter TctB family
MHVDRAGFLALVGVAIYGLICSLQMQIGSISQPSSGFFPLCLSCLLFFLAGVGLFLTWHKRHRATNSREFWGDVSGPLKIVCCTAIAIFVFETLGFIIAISLYLILLFWVYKYKPIKSLIYGLVVALITWYFFVRILGVILPKGILNI